MKTHISFLVTTSLYLLLSSCIHRDNLQKANIISTTYSIIYSPIFTTILTKYISITPISSRTNNATLTNIITPSITPTMKSTPINTINYDCVVDDGNWYGMKPINSFGITEMIVEIFVNDCQILQWSVYLRQNPGQFYAFGEKKTIPIVDNLFYTEKVSNYNKYLLFKGWFNTSTTCYGSLYIPSGYLGRWPDEDVVFEWGIKLGKI